MTSSARLGAPDVLAGLVRGFATNVANYQVNSCEHTYQVNVANYQMNCCEHTYQVNVANYQVNSR